MFQRGSALRVPGYGGGETNGSFAQPLLDNLLQSIKRAADDEQNVFRVDAGRRFFPALSHVHHGLNLAADIVGRASRHLRLFHQFEQIGLDAAAADIPARGIGSGGNLVNLVNVNDAILGALKVVFRPAQ